MDNCILYGFYLYVNSFVDIESKLKRIEEDPEGSGTANLVNLMQGVTSQANCAFEPLFERQVGEILILHLPGSSHV